MFVDHVRIFAKAGDGGPGCSSFRRESFVPRGGPDGGDGGDGGNVVLRAESHTDSLVEFFYDSNVRGKDGERGRGKKQYGKSSPPKVVHVPVGTLVYRLPPGQTISKRASSLTEDATESDGDDFPPLVPGPSHELNVEDLECLADLTVPGQEYVLCKAGIGGRGNVHFKSSRNQAPTRSDPGTPGEEGYFYLELRRIAEAGLVGYPNAGKSTLLSQLSAAKPKIAPYPFTTLHPLVGVIEFPGTYQRATIADIPGLIEGAHRNVGLGHEFLRHIMRCRLLIHVVDMAGSEGRNPLEDLANLRKELTLYNPLLGDRAWFVAANKMDLPEAEEHLAAFRVRYPRIRVVPICAEKNEGLDELRVLLKELLAESEPVAGSAVPTA